MKSFKKLINMSFSPKLMAGLSVAALAIAAIPFYLLSQYAHPITDDFGRGSITHNIAMSTGSVLEILSYALETAKNSYFHWQGRFSQEFIAELQPGIWGESFYPITGIIMISMLLISVFTFIYWLLKNILSLDKAVSLIVPAITLIVILSHLYVPREAFYWFNWAMAYSFFNAVFLLYITLLLKFIVKPPLQKFAKILSAFLIAIVGIFLGGGNPNTDFCATILVTAIIIILFIRAAKIRGGVKHLLAANYRWDIILPIFFFYVGVALNVFAPGNAVRAQYYEKPNLLSAFSFTFFNSFKKFSAEWFTPLLLLAILVMVPFVLNAVSKSNFSFKLPGLVSFISAILVMSIAFPSAYAANNFLPTRIINIMQIDYYVFFVLNIVYWLGWISKKINFSNVKCSVAYMGVMLILILCDFVSSAYHKPLNIGNYNMYSAYIVLRNGSAKNLHEQYLSRLEILESDEQECLLPKLKVLPENWVLYNLVYTDILTVGDSVENQYVARYYGKKSVRLYDPDAENETE